MTARDAAIRDLHARRPVNGFLRGSVVAMAALVGYAWLGGEFSAADLLPRDSGRNLARFLGEIRPWDTRAGGWTWDALSGWAGRLMREGGWEATGQTLAMSIAAIVLAGVWAGLLCLPSARNLACPEPFLPGPRAPSAALVAGWRAVRVATRAFMVFLRAIPEYIWAFLLIQILGLSAWPAVVALALHNAGIMGKLGSETIENLDPALPAALRGLGASRLKVALFGVYPVALPRWLLFFFYRWETCVREATVLGMLGVTTLGSLIIDSRVRDRYDEMMFFVLLGAALVLAGDLLSAVARSLVRRAS